MLIIGGFGFNLKSLLFIPELLNSNNDNPNTINSQNEILQFIDINGFRPQYNLDDMTNYALSHLPKINDNLIIAYSAGGLLALNLAYQYPAKVKQVIMLNSSPRFMEDTNWQGINIKNINDLHARLIKNETKDFMTYFSKLAACPQRLKQQNILSLTNNPPKSNLINLMQIIKTTDLRREMESIQHKLFWINSEDDVLVPATNTTGTKLVLKSSTHLLMNITELKNSFDSGILNAA